MLDRTFSYLIAVSLLAAPAARCATVLYRFHANGDGAEPAAGLVADASGTLYGTACANTELNESGTLWSLAPPANGSHKWQFGLLYELAADGSQGANPCGTLLRQANGSLFGTTSAGGAASFGTAFELDPPGQQGGSWTLTTLHNFGGSAQDGATPQGSLTADAQGRLFGTTVQGGLGCKGDLGCGVVFMLTPPAQQGDPWGEQVIHFFKGQTGKGGFPAGDLALVAPDTIFGTIAQGVFMLTPQGQHWQYQLLPVSPPLAPVVAGGVAVGPDGTLYGETELGGPNNTGTVFALHPPGTQGGPWTTEVLHNFGPIIGNTDGYNPGATLTRDAAGRLFGTASSGGTNGTGVVFRMDPPHKQGGAWGFHTLVDFPPHGQGKGGDSPEGQVLLVGRSVYVTTVFGGINDQGTIVKARQ